MTHWRVYNRPPNSYGKEMKYNLSGPSTIVFNLTFTTEVGLQTVTEWECKLPLGTHCMEFLPAVSEDEILVEIL